MLPIKRLRKMFTGDDRALAEGDDVGSVDAETGEFELTHVGPYEIVAPCGKGGMGTVYKAIDRANDRTIAIKVLHRQYDLDRKRRKRDYLGREVLLAGSLSHPVIIKMHKEVVVQEDRDGNKRRCLLMEYIDGPDLKEYINHANLDLQQKIRLCIKLCEGLDFLHQNNIIHRDIKPQNFLFSRDGSQVKIVDFGLSKSSANWRTRFMHEGGGTRLYMSPEQINKKSLDMRSDIFSFGLTMFELFTGEHPCSAKDRKMLSKQIVSPRYKWPRPSEKRPEIPPALDRIILKAMRRNLDKRYQSMTELLLDLTRLSESRI